MKTIIQLFIFLALYGMWIELINISKALGKLSN